MADRSSYAIKRGSVRRQTPDLEEHFRREVQREKARMRKRVAYALGLLGVVYVVAILVFHSVEGWTWEDSIYFTTATITTVGYGDLVPRTYVGRLFTIPLMLIGIGVGLYVIYTIQDYGRSQLDSVARHVDNLRSNGWLKKQR